MARRNYRNNLDFIASAFRACWANAGDLVGAAKVLLVHGQHAQCLSLSVLALEELGKLFCVDGLLLARADDHKAKAFAKSLKSHTTKLDAINLLPLLIANVASVDPRYGSEERFHHAIAFGVRDLKSRGNTVFALLDGKGFDALDEWKQLGFYAQPFGNAFRPPSESISVDLASAVHMLAWSAAFTLDFVLKDGNLERYIERAKVLRSKLGEADHERIALQAEEIVQSLFLDERESELGDEVRYCRIET